MAVAHEMGRGPISFFRVFKEEEPLVLLAMEALPVTNDTEDSLEMLLAGSRDSSASCFLRML